jgi:acetylornithine deacetylase
MQQRVDRWIRFQIWFRVKISGKPAHVLDTSAGVNAIQAAVHLYNNLKVLEERYNASECRHAAYANSRHPVNFNFGIIKGTALRTH